MPYVNAYLVDRMYGGPEEGGWWFDAGVPVESIKCTPEEVRRVEVDRKARCREWNKSRNSDTGSVLSEGRYEVCLQDDFARFWPESRPFYE